MCEHKGCSYFAYCKNGEGQGMEGLAKPANLYSGKIHLCGMEFPSFGFAGILAMKLMQGALDNPKRLQQMHGAIVDIVKNGMTDELLKLVHQEQRWATPCFVL